MVEFTSDYQPDKKGVNGGWFKKKMIDGLKRRSMSEDEFIDLLIEKAIVDGGIFLTELLKRYSPPHKPTLEPVSFEFPDNGTPFQKAEAVYKAMASGLISPDVGHLFIESISKMLTIEETTDLAERLAKLEELMEKNK